MLRLLDRDIQHPALLARVEFANLALRLGLRATGLRLRLLGGAKPTVGALKFGELPQLLANPIALIRIA